MYTPHTGGAMKEYLLILIVAVIALCLPLVAKAGTLGKRYFYLGGAQTIPGDKETRDVFDSITGYSGGFNMPVNENIDVQVALGRATASGELQDTYLGFTDTAEYDYTSNNYGVSLKYILDSRGRVKPYLGFGLASYSIKMKVNWMGMEEEYTDEFSGSFIAIGAEADLSDNISLSGNFEYSDVDNETDTSIGLALDYWAMENVFIELGASYASEEGDNTFSAGCGIAF
jgi:opacity protein-like surface antigen